MFLRGDGDLRLIRSQFSLNSGQFCPRFIGNMLHLIRAMIPIAGIAEVAFDFVQYGMDPRGGAIFILLDDLMRCTPFFIHGQLNCVEQFILLCIHDG